MDIEVIILDLIKTILATVVGGFISICYSKNQDKAKIKNEIKLSKYNEFEKYYNDMYTLIEKLKNEISQIKKLSDNYESNKILDLITNSFETIKKIKYKSAEIHNFIKFNKKILNFINNPYDKILKDIEDIYSSFSKASNLILVSDSFFRCYMPSYQDFKSEINEVVKQEKIKSIYNDMETFRKDLEDKTINIYFESEITKFELEVAKSDITEGSSI
ncbi:hypothetical protein [Terrisporobacter hibernicus]|uniref:Uncharacterized protein n=1 Tax=Terrisporobacter hibernicus TaxID=2813371 RepID=A0AAX2ZFV8_9FIRM|nr:hypothetical protein [Terrisporobacter hibernicus]UEL47285.1 hypothetical protein JW646_16880 [Terrisporobacter hibernicus]